jgi:hypothetical protein
MRGRRILGVLLVFLMVATLFPTVLAVDGNNRAAIAYVDENGENQVCEDYTAATAADESWSGWIVVTEDVTIEGRVYVSGEVNLILVDGNTLNVRHGIEVSETDSLTVYGQADGTGVLNAGDESIVTQIGEQNYAGIGGNNHLNSGAITINGGVVNARGAGGAAGIGGGFFSGGGKITINNGTVTAYGGDSGDGIGDGESSDDTSEITINGGCITTYGGASAAGIGVNGFSGEGFVVINGGQVKAYGGPGGGANGDGAGAGIGGDPIGAEVSDITINSGEVFAYGGDPTDDIGGVGIGGGSNGGFIHTITVNGGTVYAEGSGDFPGIGAAGGVNFSGANGPEIGTININGGQVTAHADGCDFAIGGYCEWFEEATCYINLNWTNEDDFILADAYKGTVTLAKDFAVDGSDETFEAGAVEDNAVLANKKLIPPQQDPTGYHIYVTNKTKAPSLATTTLNDETLYSGVVTFTVTCAKACVVAIDNGDGTYTKLDCTATENGEHKFTVTVTDADVTIVVALRGDVNLDGKVTTADATMVKQAYLGTAFAIDPNLQTLTADANRDGRISTVDATFIKQAYLGSYTIQW